jgi:hypothetical protein
VAWPTSSRPHDNDCLCLPSTPSPRNSEAGEKESMDHHHSQAYPPCAVLSSLTSLTRGFGVVRTAAKGSARHSPPCNHSARVVLDAAPAHLCVLAMPCLIPTKEAQASGKRDVASPTNNKPAPRVDPFAAPAGAVPTEAAPHLVTMHPATGSTWRRICRCWIGRQSGGVVLADPVARQHPHRPARVGVGHGTGSALRLCKRQ